MPVGLRSKLKRGMKWLAKRGLRALGTSPLVRPAFSLVFALHSAHRISARLAQALLTELCINNSGIRIRRKVSLLGQPVLLELNPRVGASLLLLLNALEASSDYATLNLFAKLAENAGHIIDVGANTGLFTYIGAAVAPSARILTFEPNPELAEIIRRNVTLNGWDTRVAVVEDVLGDSDRKVEFFLLDSDLESTIQQERVSDRPIREVITSQMVTLDQVCDRYKINLDRCLLKIDVEGAEEMVVEGFSRGLRSNTHPEIIIEVLSRAREAGLLDRLLSLGFRGYRIGEEGMAPLTVGEKLQLNPGDYNFYFSRSVE